MHCVHSVLLHHLCRVVGSVSVIVTAGFVLAPGLVALESVEILMCKAWLTSQVDQESSEGMRSSHMSCLLADSDRWRSRHGSAGHDIS